MHTTNLDKRIDDRYSLIRSLGSGSWGQVYLAQDVELGREVVLKLLKPEFLRDPNAIKRFQQEASVLSKLRHPNVIVPYRFHINGQLAYLAMELFEGEDLACVIRRSRQLPADVVCKIFVQITSALQYTHAENIIHRDLKPSNILFDGSTAKLIDFGLVKNMNCDNNVTQPGHFVGTLLYVAPEMAQGRPTFDCRSDVYSLGCVMFECLTGQPPFASEDTTSILEKHINSRFPKLTKFLKPNTIHRKLEKILAKCTQKDPDKRYQHAGEIRTALEKALEAQQREAKNHAPSKLRTPFLLSAVAIVCIAGFWPPVQQAASIPIIACRALAELRKGDELKSQKHYTESMDCYKSARLAVERIPTLAGLKVDSMLGEASCYQMMDDPVAAVSLSDSILQDAEASVQQRQAASQIRLGSLMEFGNKLYLSSRYAVAIPVYERVAAILQSMRNIQAALTTRIAIAHCRQKLGMWKEALQDYDWLLKQPLPYEQRKKLESERTWLKAQINRIFDEGKRISTFKN